MKKACQVDARSIVVYLLLYYSRSIIYVQAIRNPATECTSSPLCPSNVSSEVTSCTVNNLNGTLSTILSGDSSVFGCMNEFVLVSHAIPNHMDECLPATARLATLNVDGSLPVNDSDYFTTILSVTPSSEMDGAVIQCNYPTLNDLIQECILNITDPPGRPQCASANIETVTSNDPIDSVLVTLNWIEPLSEGNITGYSIIITPPLTIYPTECLEGPTNPCNVNSSVTSIQFNFNLSTPYTISVSAMNCDSQLGESSTFSVNNLEVPMAGIDRETVVVSLEYENQILKNISLSWDPLESPGGNITGCGNTLAEVNNTSYSIVQLINNTEEASLANNIPCCNYTYSPNDTYANYNITLRTANDVGVGQEALFIFINSTKYCFDVSHAVRLSNQEEVQPQILNVSFDCSTCNSVNPKNLNCTITYGTDQDNLTINYTAGSQERVPAEFTEYFFKAVVNFEYNTDVVVRGNFTTCRPGTCTPSGGIPWWVWIIITVVIVIPVVGAIVIIAVMCYLWCHPKKQSGKKSKDEQSFEMGTTSGSPPPPPIEQVDQGATDAAHAPESIKHGITLHVLDAGSDGKLNTSPLKNNKEDNSREEGNNEPAKKTCNSLVEVPYYIRPLTRACTHMGVLK